MTLPEMFSTVERAHRAVFIGALVLLMCLLFLCLLRAVKGPRVADRIVAVNMMGTMVMVMIAILAMLLGEGYLVDICLIYAMVSFIAVIVLTKVYMGVYRQKKIMEEAAAAKAGLQAAGNEAAGTGLEYAENEEAGTGLKTAGNEAAAGNGAEAAEQAAAMADADSLDREGGAFHG